MNASERFCIELNTSNNYSQLIRYKNAIIVTAYVNKVFHNYFNFETNNYIYFLYNYIDC